MKLEGNHISRRTASAGLTVVACLSAEAQTVGVMVLDQAGAQTVLQAATKSAQQRNAPSAIAVVDPAGDLLAFERMDGVRPASAELAIQKARTAARLRRPTAEVEDNIDQGRIAFVHCGDHGAARRRAGARERGNRGCGGCRRLSKETTPRSRDRCGDLELIDEDARRMMTVTVQDAGSRCLECASQR